MIKVLSDALLVSKAKRDNSWLEMGLVARRADAIWGFRSRERAVTCTGRWGLAMVLGGAGRTSKAGKEAAPQGQPRGGRGRLGCCPLWGEPSVSAGSPWKPSGWRGGTGRGRTAEPRAMNQEEPERSTRGKSLGKMNENEVIFTSLVSRGALCWSPN